MSAQNTTGENGAENDRNADEIWGVLYLDANHEERDLSSVLVEMPDCDAEGLRGLNLSKVPRDNYPFFEQTPQRMIVRCGENDFGQETMMYVTDRRVLAIGQHLSFLEIHAVEESEAWRLIDDGVPDEWLDEYVAYVDDLSEKERAREMMEQVERKVKMMKEYDKMNLYWNAALRDGEWRNTNLSSDGRELAQEIFESIDVDPRTCHLTATNAIREAWDDDRVEFCEGMAFSGRLGRATRHAWIEIDGDVAELTWPWHRFDAGNGMYYGVTVPRDVLKKRIERRGPAAPGLSLEENEYRAYCNHRISSPVV